MRGWITIMCVAAALLAGCKPQAAPPPPPEPEKAVTFEPYLVFHAVGSPRWLFQCNPSIGFKGPDDHHWPLPARIRYTQIRQHSAGPSGEPQLIVDSVIPDVRCTAAQGDHETRFKMDWRVPEMIRRDGRIYYVTVIRIRPATLTDDELAKLDTLSADTLFGNAAEIPSWVDEARQAVLVPVPAR